ncbi:MAG TPA: LysE family transporter [Opitutaceae bacterium]|nr:LysE family transporter [Opitutaceae bacterium]
MLAPVLGALTVGAMSPGPSFIYVARTSVAGSRSEGVAAAVGMGIGGMIYGGLVLLGLQAVLTRVGWLFLGLKIAGSLYLIYLGIGLWRAARKPLVETATDAVPNTVSRAFVQALFTQLSNPKTLVVYGSIFAALLPRDLPTSAAWTLLALVFAIEMGWYALVALALSATAPRQAYLRSKVVIDRFAGTVLGLLGLKLLLAADSTR